MFDSTNWVGYMSAVTLIGVSFAAAFLGATQQPLLQQTSPTQLPPIQPATVDTSFEGSHRYGYWTLVCEKVQPKVPEATPPAQPRRICRTNAQKRVQVGDEILLAAGFNVLFVGPSKEPGILFRLPPTAHASDHVNFAIDGNSMFQAPMGRCNASECIVQGMLPPDALEQMKTGKVLTVMYTGKLGGEAREIRVEQLLHGFNESFDGLTKAAGDGS